MRLILLSLPVLLLCHCGAPQPPVCRILPYASRAPAATVMEDTKRNWDILSNPKRKEDWPTAETAYNKSIAVLFDKLRCGSGDWNTRAAKLGTTISKPELLNEDLSDLDALFPSEAVPVHSANQYHHEPGLGIPVVAWKNTTPVGIPRPAFHPPNGQPRNITLLLDFSTSVPEWKFPKRWLVDTYACEGIPHDLAADWTAPVDFFCYMCDLDNLRIQNVLLPERYTMETGLYFLLPYDPKKIPVIMVHGLVSSPDAYRNILNNLSPEPWFRENYQVWLYNYPTGTPWIYNAMRFRQNVGEAGNYARSKGPDTNLKKMVILSHSMDGLLTRTAVTDPKRIVFMAVPQKGSPMANFRGTAFLSNLIRLPKTLTVGLLDTALHNAQEGLQSDPSASGDLRAPTSITSLSPNSRSFQGQKQLPLPKNITFHSIMGDKGQGDKELSSDGVVPYWSSQIEPVESELIVSSNHSVPDNREASEEIKRILLLHLQKENMLRASNQKTPRLARPLQ